MDSILLVVLFLGALIFCAHFFNAIFDRTKIPNVLLLLLIGIIAGFFFDERQFFGRVGSVFTTVTLVVIIFESGVNLKFGEIKKAIASATLITVFNFIATLIVTSFLTKFLLGFDWTSAIFMGSIIGGTSSAVVIPMLKQMKLSEKSNNVLLLESALSDVLCLVVGLAALEGLKVGALDIGSILNSMWKSFLFAALIGLAAGFLWSLLLDFIRGAKNSMFTSLAFLFVVYSIVELLQLNGGIAALCFGIVLGNTESIKNMSLVKRLIRQPIGSLHTNEKSFFSEIVFILQTYFFVYVGVSIKFGSIDVYLFALLVVVLIILARPIGIRLFVRKGVSPKEISIMSVMTPKGLVAAVLASLPFQLGLPYGEKIQDVGYAVVLLSILICSILVMIASKDPFFYHKLLGRKSKEDKSIEDTSSGDSASQPAIDETIAEQTDEEPSENTQPETDTDAETTTPTTTHE